MREINTHREEDERLSNIISVFIENEFYSKETENYNRIIDKETQVSGIDTIFTYNGREFLCDEKSAVRFINKPLKTFSLELSFINKKNNVVDGWFVDTKKMKNNSYMFIWVDKTKSSIISTIDDITSLTFALVMKNDLFDYLNKIGWTIPKLKEKARRIRFEGDTSFGNLKRNGIVFCFSNKCVYGTNRKMLPEEPINCLLDRNVYKKISVCYREYKK